MMTIGQELCSPFVGMSHGSVSVELVDLLEGEQSSLGDAKVGKDGAGGTCGTPDKEDLDAEMRGPDLGRRWVDKIRGRVADTKVP